MNDLTKVRYVTESYEMYGLDNTEIKSEVYQIVFNAVYTMIYVPNYIAIIDSTKEIIDELE